MTHVFSADATDALLRHDIAAATWQSEQSLFASLTEQLNLNEDQWQQIARHSTDLINHLRTAKKPALIDQFLKEYGLSTDAGVQLMRLAEALSRTADPITADQLIRDKLVGPDWLSHGKKSEARLMTMSGKLLHVASRWLQWSATAQSSPARFIAKSGNHFLRFATKTAVKALSSQFIFAETLDAAMSRAKKYGKQGYYFSFDMLGEAARTKADAAKYYRSYISALDAVIANTSHDDPRKNHGISIKLSALHPRYETAQAATAVPEIVEMLKPLAIKARAAHVQITLDAEEAERLDISMDVLAALVAIPELRGWHGLGFVVQAYQRRALPLLHWLKNQSQKLGAPLFIRLVKGAYWDSEIKRAHEMGLSGYPVYTRKEMTDLSYLACAQFLLRHPESFSPQFATHNAYSIAAVQQLAGDRQDYEFQRLFGMGQQLHDLVLQQRSLSSRIYAPVGSQKDLLSYLIRRLLENGANSSFVHKLTDATVDVASLAQSPVAALSQSRDIANPNIPAPRQYLGPERLSASGWDLSNPMDYQRFEEGLKQAATSTFLAGPILNGKMITKDASPVTNPAALKEIIGQCSNATFDQAKEAMEFAHAATTGWASKPPTQRAAALAKAADLLEQRAHIFHYLAIKEAGKNWSDAIDELREAVDFCRYYAVRVQDEAMAERMALGVVVCISPWNFPLAIFVGQIAAALAAGNTVVAKPAEQTPLIAAAAVQLLHEAGVDEQALQFIPGDGSHIGEALVSHPHTAGICFTGSTATANRIRLSLSEVGRPLTPLIAETGGINAMIVDSSALLEQTVDAAISSAFQSAGQRCSALRILCIQDDIADDFIVLLNGAMASLSVGDPKFHATDIGPVIDSEAQQNISDHLIRLSQSARKVGETMMPPHHGGNFTPPMAFELSDFADLDREIFGPVLHIVRFKASEKMALIEKINSSGYGLTLAIHSRIDSVSENIAEQVEVGNIYINRNQIGAVVGVQPFGGHGLSGTGPKAGGPLYLLRLSKSKPQPIEKISITSLPIRALTPVTLACATRMIDHGKEAQRQWQAFRDKAIVIRRLMIDMNSAIRGTVQQELKFLEGRASLDLKLQSPAGETNIYQTHGRGVILSLLREPQAILLCCIRALVTGNSFVQINQRDALVALDGISDGLSVDGGLDHLVTQISLNDDDIESLLATAKFDALLVHGDEARLNIWAEKMARRDGAILPILTPSDLHDRYVHEKTVTTNVAAAGGDVSLLNA